MPCDVQRRHTRDRLIQLIYKFFRCCGGRFRRRGVKSANPTPGPPRNRGVRTVRPAAAMSADGAADLVRARRTIHDFRKESAPPALVRKALDLARWAPNHHLTEPWRFCQLPLSRTPSHPRTASGADSSSAVPRPCPSLARPTLRRRADSASIPPLLDPIMGEHLGVDSNQGRSHACLTTIRRTTAQTGNNGIRPT